MRADRLSRPSAVCSSVTACTVHSRMKKPTAAISTVYATILLPRRPAMLPCRINRGNRHGGGMSGLNACSALWQDDEPTRGFLRDGFEARDRQQELFVMVDAAVAGAASQQHRLRRSVHPALYRRGRQTADFEFHLFRQGAGADRWRR